MAMTYWVCRNCGNQTKQSDACKTPPSSTAGGRCPASPSGKHVYIRQM